MTSMQYSRARPRTYDPRGYQISCAGQHPRRVQDPYNHVLRQGRKSMRSWCGGDARRDRGRGRGQWMGESRMVFTDPDLIEVEYSTKQDYSELGLSCIYATKTRLRQHQRQAFIPFPPENARSTSWPISLPTCILAPRDIYKKPISTDSPFGTLSKMRSATCCRTRMDGLGGSRVE